MMGDFALVRYCTQAIRYAVSTNSPCSFSRQQVHLVCQDKVGENDNLNFNVIKLFRVLFNTSSFLTHSRLSAWQNWDFRRQLRCTFAFILKSNFEINSCLPLKCISGFCKKIAFVASCQMTCRSSQHCNNITWMYCSNSFRLTADTLD